MLRYIEGHWYFNIPTLSMRFTRAGEYEMGMMPEITLEVSTHLLPGLFEAARNAGVLPLTPERDSRTEDLKILHRLLDLLDLRGRSDNILLDKKPERRIK